MADKDVRRGQLGALEQDVQIRDPIIEAASGFSRIAPQKARPIVRTHAREFGDRLLHAPPNERRARRTLLDDDARPRCVPLTEHVHAPAADVEESPWSWVTPTIPE